MSQRAGFSHRFGDYELVALVGKGGMAEVYRADVVSGPRAGQRVAIKRLRPELARDPSYLEMFINEANLCRLLRHPSIVSLYEAGSISGIYYMAMEFIDGRDLGQVLQRCRQREIPWPIDFAVYATWVLLDALDYAHTAKGPEGRALGIIHADISPSNVFVSRTGEIKLGDFGVAHVGNRIDPGLLGKPYFLSPETLSGEVSVRSDLWAAAVTLYELLTLQKPFAGENQEQVFAAVRARSYQPVSRLRPDVYPALDGIFERAFNKNPFHRFQTAREFANALGPLFDERIGTPLAISAIVRGLFGA